MPEASSTDDGDGIEIKDKARLFRRELPDKSCKAENLI
jgi:hypothetical protein